MANDRIYLVCRTCGERQMLYKYYPDRNGYIADSDRLDTFMTTHLDTCHPATGITLEGDPGFDLVTESDAALYHAAATTAIG